MAEKGGKGAWNEKGEGNIGRSEYEQRGGGEGGDGADPSPPPSPDTEGEEGGGDKEAEKGRRRKGEYGRREAFLLLLPASPHIVGGRRRRI